MSKSLSKVRNGFSDIVNSVFDEFWEDVPYLKTPLEYIYVSGDQYPRANVYSYTDNNKKCVFLEIAIPGIDKDLVDLSINNGVLTVKGKKCEFSKYKYDKETVNYKLREIPQSSFCRHFDLNNLIHVDENSIDISYNNGMLFVLIKSTDETVVGEKMLDWWKKQIA